MVRRRNRLDTAKRARFRRSLKDFWIGPWSKNPRNENEREGAKIARSAVRVTASESLISPVAVAVVDILGMTELLRTMPLEQIARTVAEPFFDPEGPARRGSDLRNLGITERHLFRMGFRRGAMTFSAMLGDAMVLWRRPQWEEGNSEFAAAHVVSELAKSTCVAISVNSRLGIWLRAAIAYGECIVSAAGQGVMLGLPVREAFHWERRQEWIGGMLAPSATDALRAADARARSIHGPDFVARGANFLVHYDVPLKPDPEHPEPRPMIALNWTSVFGTQFLFGFSAPIMPDPPPSSPSVRAKIENTITFCREFEHNIEDSILSFGDEHGSHRISPT